MLAGLECTEDEPDDDFMPPAQQATEQKAAAAETPAAVPENAAADSAPSNDAPGDSTVGEAEKPPQTGDAEGTAEPEQVEVEPEQPLGPPLLEGDWHQLEGVPRPPGEGARLLAWNSFGHVAAFPEQRRMEAHHAQDEQPQRFADNAGLEMASISSTACCVAAGANADGGPRLLIRPTDRWDKSVFSAAFGSADEAAEAVACGEGFVAALTSRRLLRLYSTAGLPLGLVSMPGRAVALAARGPLLLTVTATGQGDDALEYQLLDVRKHVQRAAGRLPLSRGARLRWLGFSAEFAPISVDSTGVVRALLGTGSGSWGPASGLGGVAEWVPILDLAEEEEKLGPLWTVHVARGVLFCVEVGLSYEEPRPRPPEHSATAIEGLEAVEPETPAAGFFGHGSPLREIPWRIPIGPLTTATAAAEEALREQVLARHLEEVVSAGISIPQEWNSSVGGPAKTWRSKSLYFFGQLVKAGEVERALDVAKAFLAAGGGGSNTLSMAQRFADKAGQHKLADAVAALSNGGSIDAAPCAGLGPKTVSGSPQAPQRVGKRPLPALFKPGELDELDHSSRGGGSVGSTARITAGGGAEKLAAALAATAPVATPTETGVSEPSSTPGPALTTAPAVATAMDEIRVPPGNMSVNATESPTATPPGASASPAPAAAPVAALNPFARKRPQATSNAQSPHLLRDALGLGGNSAAGMRRVPATPMGASTGAPDAMGEPAKKATRLTSAS